MQNKFGKIALCAALLTMAATAWADVTVAAETTIKGTPPGARGNAAMLADGKPHPVTTYYKGEKQRVEYGDAVTITDFDMGKSYVLDAKKKTYITRDITKVEANPFFDQMKLEVTTDVKATDEKKSIAEKAAKRYDYSAVIKMTAEDENISAFLPTITVTGAQWTTEEIPFSIDVKKFAGGAMFRSLPPMMAKGFKDLAEKMAIMKGLPLSSVTTVKFTFPKELPAEFAAKMPKDPIVTTTEVKSVTEGALNDALFAVPTDYKETKETAPQFGPSGPGGPP